MRTLLLLLAVLLEISAFGQCALPTTLPTTEAGILDANRLIAECFAPTIHQMASAKSSRSINGRADLILDVFYDGNDYTGDNWDNLEDYASGVTIDIDELDPKVYYSVVWMNNAWVIAYFYYHARDFTKPGTCCIDNHENDLEGSVFFVDRTSHEIISAFSTSHNDLLRQYDATTNVVFIDNESHAVENNISGSDCIKTFINPCDDCLKFTTPHVIYDFAGYDQFFNLRSSYVDAELISHSGQQVLTGEGKYHLEDIFAPGGLADHRYNPNTFDQTNGGNSFLLVESLTDPLSCEAAGSAANAPWNFAGLGLSFTDDWLIPNLCASISDCCIGGCVFAHHNGQDPTGEHVVEYNPYEGSGCGQGINYNLAEGEIGTLSLPGVSFVNSIIVRKDAELIIDNSILSMTPGASIILEEGAKLSIENNCLITACNPDLKWEGIHCYGDNLVEVSHSTVEYAFKAIYRRQRSGEIEVRASHATFRNNGIGVELSSDTRYNESYFYDCNFSFNNIGVAFYRVNYPFLDDCEFDGNGEGILSFESQLQISSSRFTNNMRGISLEGTYPGSSGVYIGYIEDNPTIFRNNTYGIYSSGSNHPLLGVNISRCLFENSDEAAIWMQGFNDYQIYNNDIVSGTSGVVLIGTGNTESDLRCNILEDFSEFSVAYAGLNSSSRFFENEFRGIQTANYLLASAEIAKKQGSDAQPAGNCFSDQGRDIIAIGTDFDYTYYDNQESDNCHEPDQSIGSFNKINSSNKPESCSGRIGLFGLIDPDGDGTKGYLEISKVPKTFCSSCLIDSMLFYNSEVVLLGGDNLLTPADEKSIDSYELLQKEAIRSEWIKYSLYQAIQSENVAFLQSVFDPIHSYYWKTAQIGALITLEEYSLASSVLTALAPSSNDEIDQKDLLLANLNYLMASQNDSTMVINTSELADIKSIALEDGPASGYARSMYRLHTGEILPLNKPVVPVQYRSAPEVIEALEAKIYPNPSSGVFNLDLSGYGAVESILVHSLEGLVLDEFNMFSRPYEKYKMDLSSYPQGVYLVTIKASGKYKFLDKVVIR